MGLKRPIMYTKTIKWLYCEVILFGNTEVSITSTNFFHLLLFFSQAFYCVYYKIFYVRSKDFSAAYFS